MIKLIILLFLVIKIFALDLFIIGTGGEGGLYYPTGGNICLVINSYNRNNNI